jgi:hypothetical protein
MVTEMKAPLVKVVARMVIPRAVARRAKEGRPQRRSASLVVNLGMKPRIAEVARQPQGTRR